MGAIRSSLTPVRYFALIRRLLRLTTLPLLVWAVAVGLLAMHGLHSHGGQLTTSSEIAVDSPGHGTVHRVGDEAHCDDCMARAMIAACVAILAGLGPLLLVRLALGVARATPLLNSVLGSLRRVIDAFVPSNPAWIRLAVMRC